MAFCILPSLLRVPVSAPTGPPPSLIEEVPPGKEDESFIFQVHPGACEDDG